MSDATIEVGGEVYELASSTMHDNTQTYTTASGDLYVMRIGAARAHAMTKDFAAQALVKGAPHPCRLTLGGLAYTGHVWVEGWSHSDQQVDLIVENLEPIPAAPTLDELTDPADLDWGTIRSTCAARDWRAAWGVVGTDHTGDATPGEVYLLAVARRASATAAALHHWRHVCEQRRDVPLAPGNVSWQRIKRIAAWESSARAQYVKRPPTAMQKRMEWLNERIRPGAFQLPDDILGGRYSTVNVGDLVIDDPVGSFEEVLWHAMADSATQARLYGRDNVSNEATLDALRQRAEDDAVTRGNGRGVVGVLNNPYLSAAAQRGEITGTLTLAAATRTIADVRAATRETGRQIDALTRSINPAPRGPQTRKRR